MTMYLNPVVAGMPYRQGQAVVVVELPGVTTYAGAQAMHRLLQHLFVSESDVREEGTMNADWEPDTLQEGQATDEPRVGVDVPPDGTMHALDEPACDGTASCRAITHLEGCFATTELPDPTLALAPDANWPPEPDDRESDVAWADTDRLEVQAGRDHDVIGAIRLAMVGASDQHSQIMLIQRLLTYAPDTHPRAIAPTKLLVQAITDESGQITIPQQL